MGPWEWALLAWMPLLVVLAGWWLVRWDRRGPPAPPGGPFAEQPTDDQVGE